MSQHDDALDGRRFRLLCQTISLSGVWWVLGINFLIYHVVAICCFYDMLSRRKDVHVPASLFPLIAYCVAYAFSIVYNIREIETIRMLGSLYNLSFWVCGCFVSLTVVNSFVAGTSEKDLANAMGWLVWGAGLFSVVGLVAWGAGYSDLAIPSIAGGVLPGAVTEVPLLRSSLEMRFLAKDWFAGRAVPRLSSLNPYPTALAATMGIAIAVLSPGLAGGRRRNWATIVIAVACLFLSWSRSAILALALGIIVVSLLRRRLATAAVLCGVGGLVLLWLIPHIEELFAMFSELRAGSSANRSELYKESIRLVWERNAVVCGLGAKPRVSYFHVPIGSHSMFLGSFVKTGLLGLLLVLVWQISLVVGWYFRDLLIRGTRYGSETSFSMGVITLMMAVWMVGEDIDAPQLLCFIYFMMCGIALHVPFRGIHISR